MLRITALIVAALLVLSGCAPAAEGEKTVNYVSISQEDALRLMEAGGDPVILDVRRTDEFAQGHIPGAICIPNETIGTDPVPGLENKDQLILVYCRSGRRSKEAAQKLADMGYTNVKEFGGIITWQGEITVD